MITFIALILFVALVVAGYARYQEQQENKKQSARVREVEKSGSPRFFFTSYLKE